MISYSGHGNENRWRNSYKYKISTQDLNYETTNPEKGGPSC